MRKNIWLIAAILCTSYLLLGAFGGWRTYNCLKTNGVYSIGVIEQIRGRNGNSVEYAEYYFEVNQTKYFGSTMLTGEKEFKDSIESGKRFLVIYCPNKPKGNIMIFEYPISADSSNLDFSKIDIENIDFSFWDL